VLLHELIEQFLVGYNHPVITRKSWQRYDFLFNSANKFAKM